jgi:S1-C subfamily serine protease
LIALSVIAAVAQSNAPPKDIPALANDASPSVVRIVLRDQTGKELGSGSGFVVGRDGKVVTNYHVIQIPGTAQAEVRFSDGATYQIEGVLATDVDRDLAVLKLRAVGREFAPLRLGDSDHVQIGEHVVAIGSPLAGLANVSTEETVSDGIVSGRRDWPGGKMKVFQITAPLSPGSSGGALLSANGDAIGVTFAQLTEGQNLNFAIPVSYVQPLLTDGPTKLLSEVGGATHDNKPGTEAGLAGSYTGVWQSSRFSVSGAAVMTIRMDGNTVTADIFLTGGEITSATLTGIATKSGENIWTAQLMSKKPKLFVRAVFRGGAFVGDYTYSRFLMDDRGQWVLRKE